MTPDESHTTNTMFLSQPEANRYGAFISYRHTHPDKKWAKWLHSNLENYRVPKHLIASGILDKIGRVFRDEEELPASSDLSLRINEALRTS